MRKRKNDGFEVNKIAKGRADFDFVFRYTHSNNPKIFNGVLIPHPDESLSSLLTIKVLPIYVYGVPLFLGMFIAFLTWKGFFHWQIAATIWGVLLAGYYLYLVVKFRDNRDRLINEMMEFIGS